MNSLRLKRHETFSIREGWLEKGLNIIPDEPDCFKKDDGPKYFGLGSNMCKSLKYWLIACDIANFTPQANLTRFGNLLLQYDPYLENNFSWYMIHSKLSLNFQDAPVINRIFNVNYSKFDKDLLTQYLVEYFKSQDYEIGAESSLDSDISIALKSYCATEESNPENNMNCPLSKLGLLGIENKKTFVKLQPVYTKLNYLTVYYVMNECMKVKKVDSDTEFTYKEDFNLEDLLKSENNPLKIFNINKSIMFLYLEEMKNAGLITLIKTAGLNTIRITQKMELEDIFSKYYKED